MAIETYQSHSVEQTEQIGQILGQSLRSGDVVAYKGGMGVGKTAFTRGLAKGMDVTGEVCSPTFALVHEYRGREGKPNLYHFDLYRISTFDDLYSTGFFDYLEQDCVLAIEWSENIESELPDKTILVEITITGEQTRQIRIER